MKERSLFANSAWGFITQIVRGLVGLLFIPLVISKLGMEGYGLYTILLLFTLYQGVWTQADFGYPNFLVNLISKDSQDLSANPGLLLRLRGSMGLLLLLNALLMGFLLLLPDFLGSLFRISLERQADFQTALLWILIANFLSVWVSLGGVLFMARHRMAVFRKYETAAYLMMVGVSFALLMWQPSLASLAVGYLVSQFFLAVLVTVMAWNVFRIALIPGWPPWTLFRQDWEGWKPFFFWRMNGFAQRQSDTTLISLLLGPELVAVYDIAMKVPGLLKSFLGRISEALGPFSSARRAPEHQPFMKVLAERLVQFEVGLGIVFVVIVFFFGGDLCRHWLGPEQESLARPFFLASFLNVVVPPTSILMAILMGFGARKNEMAWWPTAISVGNILLAIPVTYYFKVEGTILLTVIQLGFFSVLGILWSRADFKFRVRTGFAMWMTILTISVVWNLGMKHLFPAELGKTSFFGLWILGEALLGAVLIAIYSQKLRELRAMMAQKASASITVKTQS
jgi:O-antigen/teichoic acid export membrane protein